MSAAGPVSASQSLRDLFGKLDTEFPRESVAGTRPHQETLNHVLDLLSGILIPRDGQDKKLQNIDTALQQIEEEQGIFSSFTGPQKEAVTNILQYAKGDVDEGEALQLIEELSEPMMGGKRKRRRTTRRRKHKKSMKKRKTRGRK